MLVRRIGKSWEPALRPFDLWLNRRAEGEAIFSVGKGGGLLVLEKNIPKSAELKEGGQHKCKGGFGGGVAEYRGEQKGVGDGRKERKDV